MKFLKLVSIIIITTAVFMACSKDDPVKPEDDVSGEITKHVIVFGLDGVRSDGLKTATTPNMDALIANGAVSYTAFAGGIKNDTLTMQATSSGPGWSSILTGVWVNKHKVSSNGFNNPDYAHYPHFFKRIKETMPDAYLTSIVHWNPINQYILSNEDYKANGSDQLVALQTIMHLEEQDPTFVFIHFYNISVHSI